MFNYEKHIRGFLANKTPEKYDLKNWLLKQPLFTENDDLKKIARTYENDINENENEKAIRLLRAGRDLEMRRENEGKKKYGLWHLDSSNGKIELTNALYFGLWRWHVNLVPGNQEWLFNFRLGADTMNSFNTIYNTALLIMAVRMKELDKKLLDFRGSPRNSQALKIEKEYPEVVTEVYKNEALRLFASLYHTVGNFTIIPYQIKFDKNRTYEPFNRTRGTRVDICDYWDISLQVMKNHFDREHPGLFEKYIDTFFMKELKGENGKDLSYVDESYNIVPLLERESGHVQPQSQPHPKTLPQLNAYLTGVNNRILARGKQMVYTLRELFQLYSMIVVLVAIYTLTGCF